MLRSEKIGFLLQVGYLLANTFSVQTVDMIIGQNMKICCIENEKLDTPKLIRIKIRDWVLQQLLEHLFTFMIICYTIINSCHNEVI